MIVSDNSNFLTNCLHVTVISIT